jgi:hypothetical protein
VIFCMSLLVSVKSKWLSPSFLERTFSIICVSSLQLLRISARDFSLGSLGFFSETVLFPAIACSRAYPIFGSLLPLVK